MRASQISRELFYGVDIIKRTRDYGATASFADIVLSTPSMLRDNMGTVHF